MFFLAIVANDQLLINYSSSLQSWRFWVESDSWQLWEPEWDFFVRLRVSNWIIFYITLLNWEFLLKWYNLFEILLKQISCCAPRFLLILTAKFHYLYVKESEFWNFTSDSVTLVLLQCIFVFIHFLICHCFSAKNICSHFDIGKMTECFWQYVCFQNYNLDLEI